MAALLPVTPEGTEKRLKLLLREQERDIQLDTPFITTRARMHSVGCVVWHHKDIIRQAEQTLFEDLPVSDLDRDVVGARIGVESPEGVTPADVRLVRQVTYGDNLQIDLFV